MYMTRVTPEWSPWSRLYEKQCPHQPFSGLHLPLLDAPDGRSILADGLFHLLSDVIESNTMASPTASFIPCAAGVDQCIASWKCVGIRSLQQGVPLVTKSSVPEEPVKSIIKPAYSKRPQTQIYCDKELWKSNYKAIIDYLHLVTRV